MFCTYQPKIVSSKMYSRIKFLLIYGLTFVFMSSISVCARSPILKAGKEKSYPVTDKDSSVTLKCRPTDIIYSLYINSFNDTCSGLQPKVLTDSLLCYSRPNCTIVFNSKAPIVKTQNSSCIGTNPSMLKIRFHCIKKKIFHALNRKGETTGSDDLQLDNGMLVSHATYPWHYDQGLSLNMTLTPTTSGRNKLYISVPVLDIDVIDEVKLTNYTQGGICNFVDVKSTSTGTSALFLSSTESKVTLLFNTGLSSSTAKGFIICFHWADSNEDFSKVDICSKVTERKRRRGRKKVRRNKKKARKGEGRSKTKNGKKRKNKKQRRGKGKKRNKRNRKERN